jgi:hypothetical protein
VKTFHLFLSHWIIYKPLICSMFYGFIFCSNVKNMKSKYFAVIVNGLCKQLCLKMIPEVSGVVPRIEKFIIETDRNKCKRYYTYTEWGCLKRNHKLYAHLAFGFTPRKNNCILYGMDVSLFDSNYEALAYRLCSNLCLVTEINVQPFLG